MSIETSFLIPVFNAEDTVGAALASVLRQSVSDFEVVVVDDGSTDGSVRIASSTGDPRVRVVEAPHRGIVGALNRGLEACQGAFVARMDADDLAISHRLQEQLPMLRHDPSLAVVDGRVAFFRDHEDVPKGMDLYAQWVNSVVSPEDFDRMFLVESPVVHPAATFRRQAVLDAGGYRDGPFPEDYDLWLRLHSAGWQFRKAPSVLVHMRDRPERLTRTHPRYGRAAFRRPRQEWLIKGPLRAPANVVVWGAGRGGRPWSRWVVDHGHTLVAVVDVAPKKIGRTRAGAPIVAPEALPDLDAEVMIVAVGARGARMIIRADVRRLCPSWNEGRDWWFVS